MRIFIEPTEPLLFRTGRSFDAGESNFAESIFPPTPETMQGAIRAMIVAHTSLLDSTMNMAARFGTATITDLIGDQSGYGRFHITGLSLGKYTKKDGLVRLFPAPTSLIKVRFRGDKDPTIVQLKLQELPSVTGKMPDGISNNMQYLTLPDFGGRELEGKPKAAGWLTEQSLSVALNTQVDFPSIKSADDFYTLEPRLGIGMQNETKTTQTGYLYQIQMIRMYAHYGFVVDIRLSEENISGKFTDDGKTQTALGLPDTGWLTLGGEQRAAHFMVLGITPQEESSGAQKPGKRVYLATPAYFTRGWQPPGERFTPDHKLVAAAVNKPESIGGWSLNPNNAGGSSKTTRRCVPAGSVYFFDKPVSVTQPLTEYGWQIGYGIAYTGDYES